MEAATTDGAEERRQACALVRRLLRGADRAVLGTAMAATQLQGWPYASLVMLTIDHDLSPLLLLSDLAEHTRNFRRDDRVSLAIDGTGGLDVPLTGSRVTVIGRIAEEDDPARRARYLARHPAAMQFAGFGDFHLFRVTLERAHLVAGFGRARWVKAPELIADLPAFDDLAAAEASLVAHMNDAHADAVSAYATRLLNLPAGAWRMVGIDCEGCDLRLDGQIARLAFPVPVQDIQAMRTMLIDLAQAARPLGS